MSESGYPGFEDFQDVVGWFLVGSWWFYLSESGYPGFEDFQDVVGWLFVGSWDFSGCCLMIVCGDFGDDFVRIRI